MGDITLARRRPTSARRWLVAGGLLVLITLLWSSPSRARRYRGAQTVPSHQGSLPCDGSAHGVCGIVPHGIALGNL